MIYKCTRGDEREDGRFHYEFEGPTLLDPPRPSPRMVLYHPVALPFQVGQLYELGMYAVGLARTADPSVVPSSGGSHALPLVNLAVTGTVTPPPEG